MLGLPKSTEFNKRIPKQKFYENLSVVPAIRKVFTEQIKTIYWHNKLAATTLNIAPGKQVTEVEVFEVRLTSSNLDENVLRLIDREIPYHILFLLEHDGKYQAVMGYKEVAGSGKGAFKVDRYYRTEWLCEEDLPLHLEGLTLDAVYENFLRQIAGEKLSIVENMTLKESMERQKQQEQLGKQFAALETKMKKEKQLNRKMELKAQVERLRKMLGVSQNES
ncbi:DUF4391 domain-containing protein [Bifidobacterium moukalabense]|uniref:DUF4391 domain-containing protein n=1 Tax=Bifidobacterium moukalabense TaxID=1333651 RepID=UPI0010F96D1C|nr:DUF4391 domain-containing protein [Bifidobacterium moukalabense]